MPNHFHAIVINVGADPCVRLGNDEGNNQLVINTNQNWPETDANQLQDVPIGHEGEHVGSPLHAVAQWFKTMSTNEYIRNVKQNGWAPFNGKLWQRNYFEHIIRNEKSHHRIAEYIENNPVNWENDNFFIL